MKYLGDYAKGEVIKYRFKDRPDIVESLMGSIKNKRVLGDLLKYHNVDDKYVDKYIGRITNQEDLEDIIGSLEDDNLILIATTNIEKNRLNKALPKLEKLLNKVGYDKEINIA